MHMPDRTRTFSNVDTIFVIQTSRRVENQLIFREYLLFESEIERVPPVTHSLQAFNFHPITESAVYVYEENNYKKNNYCYNRKFNKRYTHTFQDISKIGP